MTPAPGMNNASPATRLEEIERLVKYSPEYMTDVNWPRVREDIEFLLAQLRESMAPVGQPVCPKCGAKWLAKPEDFREWITDTAYEIFCTGCEEVYRLYRVADFSKFFTRPATLTPQKLPSCVHYLCGLTDDEWEDVSGLMPPDLKERLRKAFAPAPAEVQGEREAHKTSRTYGELPYLIQQLIEPHRWDNMNISEQRDWALAATVDELEGRRIRMGLKPGAPLAEIAEMERLSATPQAPAPQEKK